MFVALTALVIVTAPALEVIAMSPPVEVRVAPVALDIAPEPANVMVPVA